MRRGALSIAIALTLFGCGEPPNAHSTAIAEQVALLEHHDGAFRAKAASALGQLGPLDKSGTLALLNAGSDRAPMVREAAARSLGELRLSEGRVVLVKLLTDSEPAVKAVAIPALLAIDPNALDAAVAGLNDSDPGVRESAARALAGAGAAGVKHLSAALAGGGPAALAATVGLAKAVSLAKGKSPEAAAALTAGLDVPQANIRTAVIRACGEGQLVPAVPGLTRLLADKDHRPSAILALGRIADPTAATALVAELGANDAAEIEKALTPMVEAARPALLAAAAAGPGPDRIAKLLLPGAADDAALSAYALLLDRVTTPQPLAAALKADPARRAAAAAKLLPKVNRTPAGLAALRALGEVGTGSPEETAAAVEVLKGNSEGTTWAVIDAAVKMKATGVLPYLRTRLDTDSFKEVGPVILALADLKDQESVPELVRRSTDRKLKLGWFVYTNALPALVKLDPNAALGPLRFWLIDVTDMQDVKTRAAKLAGQVGEPGAALLAEAMADAKHDLDWRRQQVVPVLRKMGRIAAGPLAKLLATDARDNGDDPGWWAAELIADVGGADAVLALDRKAAAGPYRARILRALCIPDHPAAVAAVAEDLANPDPILRRTAAGFIGRFRLPAKDALAKAAASESDSSVTAAIAEAQQRLAAPAKPAATASATAATAAPAATAAAAEPTAPVKPSQP